MNFYHSWFYVHILNTGWFVKGVIGGFLIGNLLAPLWIAVSVHDPGWFAAKLKKMRKQLFSKRKEKASRGL